VLDRGAPTDVPLDLETARRRAAAELAELSPRTKRFLNPQPYPVGLDRNVHERKRELIAEARARVRRDEERRHA
jgi:nicotinate phosphoribosyltransferase